MDLVAHTPTVTRDLYLAHGAPAAANEFTSRAADQGKAARYHKDYGCHEEGCKHQQDQQREEATAEFEAITHSDSERCVRHCALQPCTIRLLTNRNC